MSTALPLMTLPGWAPWIWLAIGVALIAAEAVVPGFVLLWFGVAALLLGGLSFIVDLSLGMQLLLYAPLALAILLALRRPVRRWMEDRTASASPTLNQRTQSLIGEAGQLETALTAGHGRLHLGDTVWSVTGPDLPAGTWVVVTGATGNILTVVPRA